MKSVMRKSTLLFTVISLVLSMLFNVMTASGALAIQEKNLSYKKTAGVKNCTTTQGGATDGTYVYIACNYDHNSKTKLVKLKLDGTEVMRKDFKGKLGHANDMTYNSLRKVLIVTKWETDDSENGQLVMINPDDLTETGQVEVGSGSWSNLCYNSAKDQYVSNGAIFDKDFKVVGRVYSNSEIDKLANGTNQGITCDESYVYSMRGGLGAGTSTYTGKFKIFVHDWSGNLKAIYSIYVNKYTENENLFVANGKLYVGLNMSGGDLGEQYGTIDGAMVGTGETGSNGSTHPLNIGSYNLHGTMMAEDKGDGCKAKARFETAANNIISSGMDIVGMQEYSDYDSSKSPNCNGKQVKLLDALNAGGGNWQATKMPEGSDGGGYQESQASILYNANVTSLVSDEAKNVTGGAIKDDGWAGVNCQGGSPIFHIAGFSDASGSTFYVANGHWCTVNGTQRDKDTKSLIKIMGNYTGAKFIIGDTNSEVGEEVEKIMSSNKYGDAHLTAITKNAAGYGTMAGNGKGNNIIDRIYYEEATVSVPSTYTTSNCKKATTCGSDHRPINAVFPSIMVGSTDGECGGDQKIVFDSGIPYYNITPCVCNEASSSDSTLTGDTAAEQAFTFFISTAFESNDGQPLNAAQAAGIVGNLMRETAGDGYDLDPTAKNSSNHRGILQWDENRYSNLEKFAKKKGLVAADLETQLQFIVYELDNVSTYKKFVMKGNGKSSKVVDKGLINITDVTEQGAKDAAVIVARYYEVNSTSDDENNSAYAQRKTNAAKVFNDFGGNAPGATTSTAASGNCGGNSPSSGDTQAVIDKVKEFAWEDGRRVSTQKDAYKEAIKGRYKGGKNGNDCGAFVSAVMVKSGYEPDYPGTNTTGQKSWLDKHWKKIAGVGEIDVADLQPGDVAVVAGSHVFVWVGDVDGFSGKSAEAALRSNTAPTAIKSSNTFSLPSKYNWYRKEN